MGALLAIGQWHIGELGGDPGPILLRFRSYAESTDPEVAARVRAYFKDAVTFVGTLYPQARAAGELPPSADPQALTWFFMAVGALLDLTELLGLRRTFDFTALSRVMQLASLLPADGSPRAGAPHSPQR